MNNKPQYPITIFYRDLGDWVENNQGGSQLDYFHRLESFVLQMKPDNQSARTFET
ncbi:hypothetical protein MAMP_02753 [Methylophaga aminisulfidivorans MP]|uniref:Uncharacterized protein n=1 Tax=Methylophaga aminisulfidivorans MP TaxID=1026882 RepID=F5SW38_9GAMM|nr:hypothetical protein MAMP_02753 [Methylophaga aminisulfidivorans MP]